MRLRTRRVSQALVVALIFAARGSAAELITLDDFDGAAKLSAGWTAAGKISVSRLAVPPNVRHEGVQDKFILAKAGKSARLLVKPGFPRPAYEKASAIRLRAKADGVSAEKPLVFEFQVFSSKRPAWLWRKVTIDREGWQTLELPLRYFRHSPGAALDWEEAHRMVFSFRNAGSLSIDNIQLVSGKGKHPAYLSAEELGRIAFGDKAIYYRGPPFVVVTDEKRLNGEAVLAALDELRQAIKRDFPRLGSTRRPVVLLIFAKREDFRLFWRTLGKRFRSIAPVVNSDGYAIFGVAGSSYSDTLGPVRPVYVHEACHALLAQLLGIPNQSEWLHEGVANFYQLRWSKQRVHLLTRSMIKEGRHVPLEKLLRGNRIAQRDYAQSVLFVKWLIEDAERRRQFESAMREMKQRSSTKLEPLLQKYFRMTLAQMEAAWLKWARGKLES